jgi:hypothetical protein
MGGVQRYNWNVGRFAQMLLPTFEKYNRYWVLWHYCLCTGFDLSHKELLTWMREQRAMALANSQSQLLEYHLNRLYDVVLKRIYIVNHTINNPTNPDPQFTVYIPSVVNSDTVKKFVERFVLLDKSFAIVVI